MNYLKYSLLAVITAAFVAFAIVNRETMTLSLSPLPYLIELPKFLFALIFFAAGAFLVGITTTIGNLRKSLGGRSDRKRLAAVENELRARNAEEESRAASRLPTLESGRG